MQNANGGNTTAHEAEYLGMTPGHMEGKSVVVITFRPDPNQFSVVNFAISGTQFKRLVKDGMWLIEASEQLRVDPSRWTQTPRRLNGRGDEERSKSLG